MNSSAHIPVLPQQVRSILAPKAGDVVADLTLGLGGHARMLAEHIGPEGVVVGFDLDGANLARATERMHGTGVRFVPVHGSFTDAPHHFATLGMKANVVLADLGFSSNQMDDPARGFSFAADGPLDMRLDVRSPATAADLVNGMAQDQLADLIYRYGEDPFARRIAQKLAQFRQREPIRTTTMLAAAVLEAYGPRARSSRMHPATRTFMALRIAVNDELGALETLLENVNRAAASPQRDGWLAAGARVGVISFHSLEDRLVKRAFADMTRQGLATALTRKPMVAADDECRANPRSRSAKFRAIALADPANSSPAS